MHRRQSHVEDANASLATAQASEARPRGVRSGGGHCPSPMAPSYARGSQTTRTRASNVGRAAHPRSGARVQQPTWHHWACTAAPGLAHLQRTRVPLGSPHSVGSKGGFFQAKIGPVDRQSLSGLSGRIQAESFEIFHFPLCLIHVHTV